VLETQKQEVMAATGSLVKCLGLGKRPAGISGLSTCPDPRDPPGPGRLQRLQGERL